MTGDDVITPRKGSVGGGEGSVWVALLHGRMPAGPPGL